MNKAVAEEMDIPTLVLALSNSVETLNSSSSMVLPE